MNSVTKKRKLDTTLYVVYISVTDRADSTDVYSYSMYFETYDVSNIYKYLLRNDRTYPGWIEENDDAYETYKNLDDLSEKELSEFFWKVYGEYHHPDDDYHDRYHITIDEYEPPEFKYLE